MCLLGPSPPYALPGTVQWMAGPSRYLYPPPAAFSLYSSEDRRGCPISDRWWLSWAEADAAKTGALKTTMETMVEPNFGVTKVWLKLLICQQVRAIQKDIPIDKCDAKAVLACRFCNRLGHAEPRRATEPVQELQRISGASSVPPCSPSRFDRPESEDQHFPSIDR